MFSALALFCLLLDKWVTCDRGLMGRYDMKFLHDLSFIRRFMLGIYGNNGRRFNMSRREQSVFTSWLIFQRIL